MRSLIDAIRCCEEIAKKDASSAHYKRYMQEMVQTSKKKTIMIDESSRVLAAKEWTAGNVFAIMKYAQLKHH